MKKVLLVFTVAVIILASCCVYYLYFNAKAAENYKVPEEKKEQFKEVNKSKGGGSYGGWML